MYLHLGQDVVVQMDTVIAVCDMDNATYGKDTKAFLRAAEKEGRLISVFEDLPKSFVVCRDWYGETVYLSQLNTATLLKRAEHPTFD